jgi:hypothetical protein
MFLFLLFGFQLAARKHNRYMLLVSVILHNKKYNLFHLEF